VVVELTQVAKKNTNDLMDVQLYMHFLCSHFLLKTERDGFMIYHIIIKRKNLMVCICTSYVHIQFTVIVFFIIFPMYSFSNIVLGFGRKFTI
jgi:hypothetical protein